MINLEGPSLHTQEAERCAKCGRELIRLDGDSCPGCTIPPRVTVICFFPTWRTTTQTVAVPLTHLQHLPTPLELRAVLRCPKLPSGTFLLQWSVTFLLQRKRDISAAMLHTPRSGF
jgi:hypothetical protein